MTETTATRLAAAIDEERGWVLEYLLCPHKEHEHPHAKEHLARLEKLCVAQGRWEANERWERSSGLANPAIRAEIEALLRDDTIQHAGSAAT